MWQMHKLPESRYETLKTILELEDLITADLANSTAQFFGFSNADGLRGVGGIEIYRPHALMRSLVTLPEARGVGLGREMVTALMNEAARQDCVGIWLLTENAMPFFEKLGFAAVPRDSAPPEIRASRQWAGLCADTATPMYRSL